MRTEAVDKLITDPAGVYLDGTLGGGGHAAALLERIAPAGGHLVCIDRDADAIRASEIRLRQFTESGHATLLHTNFGRLASGLPAALRCAGRSDSLLDGILLDLGVSSHQLDSAARGFSHTPDGPLDMRMDADGGQLTAREIVNAWDAADIKRALRRFGDESQAGRIASAIVDARPLEGTTQLAAVVRTPPRRRLHVDAAAPPPVCHRCAARRPARRRSCAGGWRASSRRCASR